MYLKTIAYFTTVENSLILWDFLVLKIKYFRQNNLFLNTEIKHLFQRKNIFKKSLCCTQKVMVYANNFLCIIKHFQNLKSYNIYI